MPGTNRMNAECGATHVILVSNGIYGEKLLYVYPFVRKDVFENGETTKKEHNTELSTTSHFESETYTKRRQKPTLTKIIDKANKFPLTEFAFKSDILGHMLIVHKDAYNKPFELKVDSFRFVAWPKSWRTKDSESDGYMFSIVFVLKTTAEPHTVEAYQRLSKKLAISFVTLQHCEGYLEKELRIMEENDHEVADPFKFLKDQCKMARTIKEVFDEVVKTGSVHKYINNFIEIGFCDEAYSLARNSVMPKGRKEIKNIVRSIRPYHGILLLEDVLPTPDANPSVALLLRHCSPDRSILDMSTASGIPIFEVFMIIRHLLLWTRAVLIYPLCNTNVYTSATSPQPLEKMIEKFAVQFGANIHLAAGLAHFNPPARLDTFIRPNLPLSEQQVRAKLVVALLRHQMLMQLHQFCYIIKPFSTAVCPKSERGCPEVLQKKISESCIDKSVQPIVADICEQLLLTQSFAQVEGKLSVFISMAPLMDGNHHMEDIKYQTNLKRSIIEGVLDSFQLVIAKFLRPDFVAE